MLFFLSGRSWDSHSKVLKCQWDGAKQRSGQGQISKCQLSNMKKHGHAALVFRSSFKKEFTCNSLKSVSKTLNATKWLSEIKVRSQKANFQKWKIVMRHMFLGHFPLRNSLVRVLNVYLRQVKVEEHRSREGQVIKGQLSYSIEYSRVIHVLCSFLKNEFITTGLKSVFHSFQG